MSLGNLGELKTAIATRLARSNMASLIPDFVLITHLKMMRGEMDAVSGRWMVPPLRIDDMIATATLTPSEGLAALPADFLGVKSLSTATSGAPPLRYMAPADMRSRGFYREAGVPVFYAIERGNIVIAPFDSNALALDYYQEITAPADDADTNAIFTKGPQAYLYGALAEAFTHIRQAEQAALYASRFGAAVAALNAVADQGLISGEPLVQAVQVIV